MAATELSVQVEMRPRDKRAVMKAFGRHLLGGQGDVHDFMLFFLKGIL
jgi:hypothetical protein